MDFHYMNDIDHTYVSLLADVASSSGFSEIRGSYEGLQWCLIQAPKLEKYVLNCIESGESLDLTLFPTWLRRLAAGSILDPVLLRYLRQLLLFSYKAYIQHDNSTNIAAIRSFVRVNSEVGAFTESFARSSPYLTDLTRKFCQSVMYQFDGKDIIPHHGPGAVTTSKMQWKHWYPTIDALYPYSDYLSLYMDRLSCEDLDSTSQVDCIKAKLIAVPKDSRGPRLICVHPAEAIWIQQGLRYALQKAITRVRYHKGIWPHGHIHFDDQTVNGRIALLSSRSRRYATLDMKEASDRIPHALVSYLLGFSKYKYFACCRAQKYFVADTSFKDVFDDNIHSYAPMGNATTFPIQSLVFWAICCASLQRHGLHQSGSVFVFGDDIIVPAQAAPYIIDDLESFGLVVNRTKSFWRGGFRESCGVDAYHGIDVTPTRWKLGVNAEHLSDLQSLSDLAQRLRLAGYFEAAATAYSILRSKLKHNFGKRLFFTNNVSHGGIAELSYDSNAWSDSFWDPSLQWFRTPVWRVKQLLPNGNTDRRICLLESLCSLSMHGRSNVLDRAAPCRSRLERGWIGIL